MKENGEMVLNLWKIERGNFYNKMIRWEYNFMIKYNYKKTNNIINKGGN